MDNNQDFFIHSTKILAHLSSSPQNYEKQVVLLVHSPFKTVFTSAFWKFSAFTSLNLCLFRNGSVVIWINPTVW